MVVAAPDMGSWWRWLMGHHWPLFKIPEHVLYFDRKSLKALVRQAVGERRDTRVSACFPSLSSGEQGWTGHASKSWVPAGVAPCDHRRGVRDPFQRLKEGETLGLIHHSEIKWFFANRCITV